MREADCHERDGAAAPTASLTDGWALVPPASGAELVAVLRQVGFDARDDGSGNVWMERWGSPVLRVPQVERLGPEVLVSILKVAGITPAAFVAYLDQQPLEPT